MIVVSRLNGRGVGDMRYPAPFSRTMIYPPNRDRVAQAQAAAGGWTQVSRLNGLQGGLGLAMPAIPTWGWIVGGLAAGGIATFAFLKMRKRR